MKVFLSFLLILCSFPFFAQTSEIDSLSAILSSCQPLNGDSCQTIFQEIITSAKDHPDEQVHPNVLMYAGKACLDNGDFEKGKQLLLDARTLSDSLGLVDVRANSNRLLGIIEGNLGDHEQSLLNYFEAARLWEESGNKEGLANAYLGISSIFFDTDRLPKSQYYDNLVNQIAEELDNDELRLSAIANFALNSMHYGINYYMSNIQDSLRTANTLDTLNFYFEKSEIEYNEGIILAKETGNREVELSLLNNLVALTMNMEKNEKALEIAKETELIAEEIGEITSIIQSKVNMSSAYRKLEKLDMAVKYGEESRALANEYGLEQKENLANMSLYKLYKAMGNYSKANGVLEEMRAYDKKVGDVERNRDLAELESIYQNTKNEKQILVQKNNILELAAGKARIEEQQALIIGGGLFLLLVGFFWFQFNRIRKERNDRVVFAEALILTQEEERKRISRDLHDGIGQSLLLIKKQADATTGNTEEKVQLISETLDELRSISRDLHPFQLKEFGLDAAVQHMITEVEKTNGLFISKSLPNIDGFLTEKSEIHVYRTIQEALNNVVKHANATAVKISGVVGENEISISVQDNGLGFEQTKRSAHAKSLGLRTMTERMASFGGKVVVESGLSQGTTITMHIPKG